MTDTIPKEHRSWNMSRIRSRDTKPEKAVRSLLHRMGYRFRLHDRSLPGKPDIVLPRYRTAVFVHGCFWHRHKQCQYAYTPKSRIDFWTAKFQNNVIRDKNNELALRASGWHVLVVWECEIKELSALSKRLDATLQVRQTNKA